MTNLIKLLFFSTIILLAGCPKKQPQQPAFNVAGMKTTIKRVQVSPIAFAGAKIVVLGFIADITYAEEIDTDVQADENGEEITEVTDIQEENILVLSDSQGNTINVQFEETDEFAVNDTVIVSGKYNNGTNTIVSEEIIKVIIDKDGIRPYNDLEIESQN